MVRITIIDAHPDPDPARYVHALADAYAEGATEAGHDLRRIDLAGLNIPLLASRRQWTEEPVPAQCRAGQEAIHWAEHIAFFYPLWLGDMPALLKAFLEQVLRPGFAIDYAAEHGPGGMLGGRSARIVVTMGMPALFYRAYYGAHSVRAFKRNMLAFVGIDPLFASIIGNVEGSPAHRERWLRKMQIYGRLGE